MAQANPHEERLKELEANICESFAWWPDNAIELQSIPTEVFIEFLISYGLEGFLSSTVGHGGELASSCMSKEVLEELSIFRLRKVPEEHRTHVIAKLGKEFGLRADEQQAVFEGIEKSKRNLEKRRKVVFALRRSLFGEGPLNAVTVKAAFDQMYPGNPMFAGEIDVVATATALYWRLPVQDSVRADEGRSEEQASTARQFIEKLTSFNTSNFRQFPAFHAYDSRKAERSLLNSVTAFSGLSRIEVCNLINRSVWIESTTDIRLYIIHDTWGHVWQGDFSNLPQLYESVHFCMTPLSRIFPCMVGDRVVTKSDLFENCGTEGLVPDLDMIRWTLLQRLQDCAHLLVTPITAELMADIAEFKFCLDAAIATPPVKPLPSSSIFDYRAAKMDFGWVSPLFFVQKYCRSVRAGLMELLVQSDGATCNFDAVLIPSSGQSGFPIDGLSLARLTAGEGKESLIEQLFIQVTRIFSTVNKLLQVKDAAQIERVSAMCPLLIISMARVFARRPDVHFWHLDRYIGCSIPVLIACAINIEKSLIERIGQNE